MTDRQVVLVVGGTFDPIHFGHLRTALDLSAHFPGAQIKLIPAADPPHRSTPGASAEHRAAMVELAVANEPKLSCDRRELGREGASYTYDTLDSLRDELGDEVAIVLVMGSDAFNGLSTWHRWKELLSLAHILVQRRPDWPLAETGEAAELIRDHRVSLAELSATDRGSIAVVNERQLDISATEIRELLASNRSANYLLPSPVLSYIRQNSLYDVN